MKIVANYESNKQNFVQPVAAELRDNSNLVIHHYNHFTSRFSMGCVNTAARGWIKYYMP